MWKDWCTRATCRSYVKGCGGHAGEFSFFWSPAAGVTLHLSFGALQERVQPAQSKQCHLGLHWDWRGAFKVLVPGWRSANLRIFPDTFSPLG